jgi:hypothetical protein
MRSVFAILLRFLFRLTLMVASGAAVTGLCMALVFYFFPDPTERHQATVAILETHQEVASAKPPVDPAGQPVERPGRTEDAAPSAIPAVPDTPDMHEPASRMASDPSAQSNQGSGLPSNGQPGPSALRQEAAAEREQAAPISGSCRGVGGNWRSSISSRANVLRHAARSMH